MTIQQRVATAAGRTFAREMQRINARHPWSHNEHFNSWIVANLPECCGSSLDVGCGQGELLARLAPHVKRVVGNDIDAAMVDQSVQRCSGLLNVSVNGGRWAETAGPFDVVTMVAVLHHLDVEDALQEVKRLLSPGGRFLAVGLAPPRSFRDHLWEAASIVTNPLIGFVKHPWPSRAGTQPPPYPVQDPTMSFDELQSVLERVMPGSVIRHHLGFRHTIAWTKP